MLCYSFGCSDFGFFLFMTVSFDYCRSSSLPNYTRKSDSKTSLKLSTSLITDPVKEGLYNNIICEFMSVTGFDNEKPQVVKCQDHYAYWTIKYQDCYIYGISRPQFHNHS